MSGFVNDDDPIEEILSLPIILSERIRQSADESSHFKFECSEVSKQVDRLSHMLRSIVRFSTNSSPNFYDRPVRRIFQDVSKTLDRSLTLIRKCRRRNFLRRVVSIVGAADFRKLFSLLDASVADMKWLLSVFDAAASAGGGGGIVLSLPPIASNDPILAWVWSFIATIHLGQLSDKIEAANELSSVAKDNNRNKKMIAEEGGVPPLLKLLKESTSPEAQIAAATALFYLANDQDRARLIANEAGVPIIVKVLGTSPTRVQVAVANLVARVAEHDSVAQEGFARENVIRPLVTMLSFDTFMDGDVPKVGKSIHSIVEINKRMDRSSLPSFNYKPGSSTNVWVNSRKERENETPELKLKLKVSCAEALWMLARGSVSNSRRITETKGLLCLAKLIEEGTGELRYNCLMTVMEITAAAESNADLRRSAFKTNSPAAKAVVDQLLGLIKESDSPGVSIPAIRTIGFLARTFPARQTNVIGPLVEQVGHWNQDVGTEAAISLGKFACPDNFLCAEHSKTIIEFDAVPPLMRLLRGTERTQYHVLVLLCYLAIHAGNSEALEQARVLTALEGSDRSVAAQHSDLRELVAKAIYHLNMYHTGVFPPQRRSYSP